MDGSCIGTYSTVAKIKKKKIKLKMLYELLYGEILSAFTKHGILTQFVFLIGIL